MSARVVLALRGETTLKETQGKAREIRDAQTGSVAFSLLSRCGEMIVKHIVEEKEMLKPRTRIINSAPPPREFHLENSLENIYFLMRSILELSENKQSTLIDSKTYYGSPRGALLGRTVTSG